MVRRVSPARAHNARVRSSRQRLQAKTRKLNTRTTTSSRYITYTASVRTLQWSFVRIEDQVEQDTGRTSR
jgi:hypothetical protein